MQIVVKTPAGEAIALEVESADTTEYVKAKALHASALSSPSPSPPADHHQRYCLVSAAGKQLGRRTTLADHGIVVDQEDGATATLDLVVDPEPPLPIVVKTLNLEDLTVDDVYGSDTIFSVMAKIHREHGIPTTMQRFLWRRQLLVSGRTLASYGVDNKSEVYCILVGSSRLWGKQWMLIFVAAEMAGDDDGDGDWKGWKGFYLEVHTTDTAGTVKERIELEKDIAASQQRLVLLDGKQMDDGIALTEYGLRHKSGIRLLFRPL